MARLNLRTHTSEISSDYFVRVEYRGWLYFVHSYITYNAGYVCFKETTFPFPQSDRAGGGDSQEKWSSQLAHILVWTGLDTSSISGLSA